MARHELLTSVQEIPDGYDTYSVLLIPDSAWLAKIGDERYFQLYRHFKLFGDAIGPDHLAAWLFSAHWASYHKYVDLEAYAVVHGNLNSITDAAKLALGNLFDQEKIHGSIGGYDVIRAKYICASYGLRFNSGPFVAFFERKPEIPIVYHGFSRPGPSVSRKVPSKPTFLLQFNGISFDDVLKILSDLEYEIISGGINVRKLRIGQFRVRIERRLQILGENFGNSLRLIKDVKEVIPIPNLENIFKRP